MKKHLTERNIILLVLCIIVVGGGIGYFFNNRQQAEDRYTNALLTAVNKGNDMIGGRMPIQNEEHYHELRDAFIVAQTQLLACDADRAELCDRYSQYPKAFHMFQWYAGSGVVHVPLSIEAFSEESDDTDAQKFREATKIMWEHYYGYRTRDEESPAMFQEYLELIENDPRIDELGFEEIIEPY